MHTVTKHYRDLPAAHRQPKHDGHCSLIHGHNWGFDIVFTADRLDHNSFVVDVGQLRWVRDFLNDHFDHTLLLNEDDPQLDKIRELGVSNIVVVPNCGMEELARWVLESLNTLMPPQKRGLRVIEVTCWEDSKNCATWKS